MQGGHWTGDRSLDPELNLMSLKVLHAKCIYMKPKWTDVWSDESWFYAVDIKLSDFYILKFWNYWKLGFHLK